MKEIIAWDVHEVDLVSDADILNWSIALVGGGLAALGVWALLQDSNYDKMVRRSPMAS